MKNTRFAVDVVCYALKRKVFENQSALSAFSSGKIKFLMKPLNQAVD